MNFCRKIFSSFKVSNSHEMSIKGYISNNDKNKSKNFNNPDTFEDMTNAEVTTMSNDWYDAYVAGKE